MAQPVTPVHSRYYELLGCKPGASAVEIKKNYMKLAKQYHPDKNPSASGLFQNLTKAYTVLSDPEKRAIYDKFGEQGIHEGVGSSGSSSSGGAPMGQPGQPIPKQKGSDIYHRLPVRLEDIYLGSLIKLPFRKRSMCPSCDGKGGNPSATPQRCPGCNGSGFKVIQHVIAVGMIQQLHHVCSDCLGQREVYLDSDRCLQCNGSRVVDSVKTLDVLIERGMEDNHQIIFEGEADQAPNTIPGNVIIIISMQPHDTFVREGDHLLLTKEITLLEALTGVHFRIQHLDGRHLQISSAPSEVINPGDIRVIQGEGLPNRGNVFQKGNLIIRFKIIFPPSNYITPESAKVLASVLPKPKLNFDPAVRDDQVDNVSMAPTNAEQQQNLKHDFHKFVHGNPLEDDLRKDFITGDTPKKSSSDSCPVQ